MNDEFKRLYREMKILRAKKDAGGRLHPKDERRLVWLEERLGDAEAVRRIQVDEPVDAGPKVLTSDDHWATEMSQDLLDQAEDYEPEKVWEKDARARPQRSFEVRDTREGKATFKQEGLSNFAIEATEDMREGEISLAEVPQEEEESARKMDHHRPVYAKDESERLTKKSSGGSNPFALDIADSLVRGLDKHKDYSGTVPDSAAKSWDVDVGDEDDEEAWDRKDTRAIPPEEISDELQGMLRKSYELPHEEHEDVSLGARTSHDAGDQKDDQKLDLDLMRDALEYAEQRGLVDEERQTWATDEEGRDIQYEEETVSLRGSLDADTELPMPNGPPPQTQDLSIEEEPTGATMELSPGIPAGQVTAPMPAPAPEQEEDDEDDDLGVLIPPPPPPPPGDPGAGSSASLPTEQQPVSYDAETRSYGTDDNGGVLIPDPPQADADDPATEIERPRPRFNDGVTTRPGVIHEVVEARKEATTDEGEVLIPPPPESVTSKMEIDEIVEEMEETHLLDAPDEIPDLSDEVDVLEIPVQPERAEPQAVDEPPEVAIEVEPEPEMVMDDDTEEGDLVDLAEAGAELITGGGPRPTPENGLEMASDSDVEMVSDDDLLEAGDPGGAQDTVFSPAELGAEEVSGDESELDVDSFWGLSDDEESSQQVSDAQQTLTGEEEPAPRDTGSASKPLPALSFTPGTVPDANRSSSPAPVQSDPAPSGQEAVADHAFLDSLFSQAEQEVEGNEVAPAPEEQATSGQARRVSPVVPLSKDDLPRTGFGAKPAPAAPQRPQATGDNDLRGPRKATVHYKDGVTRRGVIGQVDTDADLIRLDPQPGSSAPSEDLVALSLKTIFLMLPRGTPPPERSGMSARIVLIDGRRLEGTIPDYDPQRKAFTLFPAEKRGNIERVIVFNDAIKNIWFDE